LFGHLYTPVYLEPFVFLLYFDIFFMCTVIVYSLCRNNYMKYKLIIKINFFINIFI
jgi:hypothetical protein